MSGLIKVTDTMGHAAVRPLTKLAPPPIVSPQDEERERLRVRTAQLESELRQRDVVIAGLRSDVDLALERGKTEGHAAGLKAAEDRQAERLAILESGVRQARARLDENLASLERLAAALAGECLDTVLGDRKYRAQTVRKILAAQSAKIEKSALLAVELSSSDFPDAEALAVIERDIAPSQAALSARAEIPSGGCRMVLRLGQMDVGLDQQWGSLRDLLAEIASPKGAA
jgi:flagellar biosynthesis/type III secretory pathway protein FliH